MDIVEQQRERPFLGHQLEQRPYGAGHPVALGRRGGLDSARRPHGGQDRRQLRQMLLVHALQAAHVLARDVLVQSASTSRAKGRSRSSSLARPAQDDVPALQRAGIQLGEQSRLADARLAAKAERTRVTLLGLVQNALHEAKLLAASYQSGFDDSHQPSVAPWRAGLWPPGRRRIAQMPVVKPTGGTS